MDINQVVNEIRSAHFPVAKGNRRRVKDFEERTGCTLPLDMKKFYGSTDGARLFDERWPPFFVLPLEQVEQIELKLLGDFLGTTTHTAKYFAFCDVQDGNYIAADLASVSGSDCNILDCFHETFPECNVIARSFTSFMESALASQGKQFWLY